MRTSHRTFAPNPSAMQTHRARSPRRHSALVAALALAPAAVGLSACHDLTEQPASAIAPASFFQNDAQIQAGLAGVYSGLRATQANYYYISQVSSDETIVPTRGTDWLDGGQWVELWQHTYGPSSGAGNQNMNPAYHDLSRAIAKANATIQSLGSVSSPAATAAAAECRALRAWYYFELQDLFGGVPLVTQASLQSQPRVARDSIARFIEAELVAARPSLPAVAASQGRITQGTIDAILANLYLNWPIYTGTPTASGITPGSARYADVITVTDRFLNSGNYPTLTATYDTTGWKHNFAPNNQDSKENVFVVRNKAQPGLGLDLVSRAGHYNTFSSPGGYNGFSTIADTYNQFDPTDARRSVFLIGPQKTLDTGVPATLRDGKTLLNFTPTITSLNAAAENEGIRNYKFSFDPAHFGDQEGNDFTIFRVGTVMLDRAEALWQVGRTAEALTILNTLRARTYSPPQPLAGPITASVMLHERLTELTFEGHRRQDMIRLGSFDGTRQFKTATSGYHALFPIPTAQLQSNPLLTQNPGY